MRYLTASGLLLDIVAAITGDKFGKTNPVSSVIYSLVGIAGVNHIPLLVRRLSGADDTP